MSLTFGASGTPIAVVSGGKHDSSIIRLSTDQKPECAPEIQTAAFESTLETVKNLSKRDRNALLRALAAATCGSKAIEVADGMVIVTPSLESERVLIAGKSGSGKSTIAALYMYEYLRMFPDRRIILISRHDGEKAYARVKHQQLPLESFATDEEPLELTDLANSLIVFDDTDNLQDKQIAESVKRLNEDLISNGRKYGIHVVTIVHQLMNYKATRNLILEANKVFVFPAGAAHQVRQFLEKYGGLEPDAIKKIFKLQSRWVMLSQTVPQYVVYEHGAYIV